MTETPTGNDRETGRRPVAVARHWAIPVLLLGLLAGVASAVGGGAALVAAGLAVVAALNLWTGLGRRRLLATDGFIHVGASPRRDRTLAGVSAALSMVLLLATAGVLSEPRTAGDAADNAAPDNAIAAGLADHLDGVVSQLEVVNQVLEAYGDALEPIVAELRDPQTDAARRGVLSERVDFIEGELDRVCLLAPASAFCAGRGFRANDALADAAARERTVQALLAGLEEVRGWR